MFPVRWENNKILILDETKLPFREEYLEVVCLRQALQALSQMKTRAFGQVLLFFYTCLLCQDAHSPEQLAADFQSHRPTFNFTLLANLLKAKAKEKGLKPAIDNFLEEFIQIRKRRSQRLAHDLPEAAAILTLCNVNGELLYLYEALQEMDKEAVFYVSETRPYLQGSRLTFWELRRNNIPAYLVCDNQAAALMQAKRINAVVVGSDRSSLRNDIVNKIGTYALARLAKEFNIPFYALTQYPQDIDISKIEIEERPAKEVFMFFEEIPQIEAIYPAFDVTPGEWVTATYEIGRF